MAGYVRPPLKLQFEDEEFDGLNVWAKRVSLTRVFELQELAEKVAEQRDGDAPAAGLDSEDESNWVKDPDTGERHLMSKLEKELRTLFGRLLPCLLAWNLQEAEDPLDDDSPRHDVPLTMAGLLSQDPGLALALVGALVDSSTGASGPLAAGSPNGKPSPEVNDLTALSSASLPL